MRGAGDSREEKDTKSKYINVTLQFFRLKGNGAYMSTEVNKSQSVNQSTKVNRSQQKSVSQQLRHGGRVQTILRRG